MKLFTRRTRVDFGDLSSVAINFVSRSLCESCLQNMLVLPIVVCCIGTVVSHRLAGKFARSLANLNLDAIECFSFVCTTEVN